MTGGSAAGADQALNASGVIDGEVVAVADYRASAAEELLTRRSTRHHLTRQALVREFDHQLWYSSPGVIVDDHRKVL